MQYYENVINSLYDYDESNKQFALRKQQITESDDGDDEDIQ